ncbi:MAG: LPP20 family lipoprotein [Sulfurimonas sp.]|uniref:LPP20 family lipoprotein n=1 Tax=Sulfurimonas sp. TaxID=2022749 RepID=UPI002633B39D|nr:LPP20 family lipoprotein [Sulfurimonas sp.]MCW8895221.1 LPP20 family lipoprotein [Sulfurimonas sp.]MCW8954674.1 LPP20 family lipoprotein [Sulfurimonas sp.]MCW9068266.1 LPP20 family lipoprotein [Sulfurimonas sp.]
MKYTMLLVALLSASSLFGANQVQTVDTKANTELAQAKAEAAQAKAEAAQAKTEATIAKEQLAQADIALENATKPAGAIDVEEVLQENATMHISVTGQGVAPMNTSSPAQAYALAKRAAIADAYRAIAEKVKGVRIDGQDLIKNMMVKRSTIRTSVKAMVRNANIVETTFKEGLCEVEMEIVISHSDFAQ